MDALSQWLTSASGQHEVEHIISLDSSDTSLFDYTQYVQFHGSVFLCGPNKNVVEATNSAASASTGDILIYMSDDIFPPENWDVEIAKRVSNVPDSRWLLRVLDGHQPKENLILTVPIMSRALYEHLGYFWNPLYQNQWVDCDAFAVTRPFHIDGTDLTFAHKQGPDDETYKRGRDTFNSGREIFNSRAMAHGWPQPFNKLGV